MVIKKGVAEDRSREQFTAEVIMHPPGEGGKVYLATAVAQLRANSLDDLVTLVTELAYEGVPRGQNTAT